MRERHDAGALVDRGAELLERQRDPVVRRHHHHLRAAPHLLAPYVLAAREIEGGEHDLRPRPEVERAGHRGDDGAHVLAQHHRVRLGAEHPAHRGGDLGHPRQPDVPRLDGVVLPLIGEHSEQLARAPRHGPERVGDQVEALLQRGELRPDREQSGFVGVAHRPHGTMLPPCPTRPTI